MYLRHLVVILCIKLNDIFLSSIELKPPLNPIFNKLYNNNKNNLHNLANVERKMLKVLQAELPQVISEKEILILVSILKIQIPFD